MAAPARRLPLTAGQAVAAVPGGTVAYRGMTARETTGGTPAVISVHQGTSATGALLDTVRLGNGQSRFDVDPAGTVAQGGIFVEITGTVQGSLFVG